MLLSVSCPRKRKADFIVIPQRSLGSVSPKLKNWLTHKRLWAFYFSSTNVSGAQKLVEQGWHSGPREVTGVSHLSLVAPGFLPSSYTSKNSKQKEEKNKHTPTYTKTTKQTLALISSKIKVYLGWHPRHLPMQLSPNQGQRSEIHKEICFAQGGKALDSLQATSSSTKCFPKRWNLTSLSLLHWFLLAQPTWGSRGYLHPRFPPS